MTCEIGQCWFDKKSGLIDKLIKPNFSINKIINGFSMGQIWIGRFMKHVIRTWFEWIFALYSKIIITDYRLTFEHGNFELPEKTLASKLLKVISESEFASVTCLGVKILEYFSHADENSVRINDFLKIVLNSLTRF